jgi:pseudouridine-5'-phosphate glycosidase
MRGDRVEIGGDVARDLAAAVTAVIDGVVRAGLDDFEQILGPARKTAERDLAVAVGQRWDVGATTVSASVAVAAAAGITVFATGGIGGVHRGSEITGDISADLDAIAAHRVVTVAAGAKAFLDLGRTLEYLEAAGVTVLGWRHDDFPAFYTRSSGLPVPHRVEAADEVARIFAALSRGGLLLAVPIPVDDELDAALLDGVIGTALDDCAAAGVTGAAITPFVLGRIAEATDGRSLPANLALAEHNAAVAAEVAVAVRNSEPASR